MIKNLPALSVLVLAFGCRPVAQEQTDRPATSPQDSQRPVESSPHQPATYQMLSYDIHGPNGKPITLSSSRSLSLTAQLRKRLDPHGTERVLTRIGVSQLVEILLPGNPSAQQLDRVKRRISQLGFLEFRILANHRQHQALMAAAASNIDPASRSVFHRSTDGSPLLLGKWVRITRSPANKNRLKAYRYIPHDDLLRNASNGELVSLDDFDRNIDSAGLALAKHLESRGIEEIEVLLFTGDDNHLHGGMITSATSLASDGQSTIDIHFTPEGTAELARLTSINKPDLTSGRTSRLAIVLDDQILSAPRILEEIRSEHVFISGQFGETEAEDIAAILRSGSLPKDVTLQFRGQQVVHLPQPGKQTDP